jgi:hypothetical protein
VTREERISKTRQSRDGCSLIPDLSYLISDF